MPPVADAIHGSRRALPARRILLALAARRILRALAARRILRALAGALFAAVALLLPASHALAQGSMAAGLPRAVGSVEGHLVCSDTGRPARFADVYLIPREDPPAENNRPALLRNSSGSSGGVLLSVHAKADFEGAFHIDDVPPGDYFVLGHAAGYILPLNEPTGSVSATASDASQLTSTALAGHGTRASVLSSFPLVTVRENRTESVHLTLQRGAVLSGRVLFDDGSPVSGVYVQLTTPDGKRPSGNFRDIAISNMSSDPSSLTDDDGNFRISGVAPGKWLLNLTLQTQLDMRMRGSRSSGTYTGAPPRFQSLTVWSPGVFRRSEAKLVEVGGDERIPDLAITVRLGGLHRISGHVMAASTQNPVASGLVRLSEGNDLQRDAPIEAGGFFHFDLVPEGTYKLQANGWDGDVENPRRPYQAVATAVTLGDRDTETPDILLPESPKASATAITPPQP